MVGRLAPAYRYFVPTEKSARQPDSKTSVVWCCPRCGYGGAIDELARYGRANDALQLQCRECGFHWNEVPTARQSDE